MPSNPAQARTLWIAAAGTALALAGYTTQLATLAGTAAGLGAGPEGQAWILSSMSVGLAVGLLPAGAIGDDHGRRRMFVIGSVLLAVASVVAALAPNTTTLVLARIVQGLGGAALVACSLGLIGHVFPPGPGRLRATGMWGAAVGGGIAIGPLLAAGLDVGYGWRASYWLLAALALVLAGLAAWLLDESVGGHRRPVDLPGMVLLGAALSAVLAGLVESRLGWDRPVVPGLLVAGIALAVVFVLVELRRADPMLDLRLLARPDFAGATIAALATGAGIIATMSFLPTLVQRGLGDSVLTAAAVLLAWSATSVLTALLARRLPARFSPRAQLVTGLVGVAIGQLLLIGIGVGDGVGRLLPGLFVAGAASGVLNAALGRQAVAAAPPGLAGVGSGTNNTARYLGAALGVTMVAVLAGRPDAAGLIAGWTPAVLAAAGISVLGAVAVLVVSRVRVERPVAEARAWRTDSEHARPSG
jgi:predicted MFS family arabinose efflux permease